MTHDDPRTRTFAVPKKQWGDGPWQHEPDRVDFTHAGLPCLLLRNGMGAWCGYAAVPPGHPLHGCDYAEAPDFEVHGGLTYAGACSPPICHEPAPGEPDDVWWFGFDCGHAFDLQPAFRALDLQFYDALGTYRDVGYARSEVERLADQLAALVPPASPKRSIQIGGL